MKPFWKKDEESEEKGWEELALEWADRAAHYEYTIVWLIGYLEGLDGDHAVALEKIKELQDDEYVGGGE